MSQQFKLPDIGEGLTEAEIVAWRVAVGDSVQLNQILLEVETAKAVVELPSPYAGTVMNLLAAEGETVPVGSPIITIGDGAAEQVEHDEAAAVDSLPAPSGSGDSTPPGQPLEAPIVGSATARTEPPDPAPEPVLVGYGVRTVKAERRPRKPMPSAPRATGVASNGSRPRATPPIRKLARDLNVDLATVRSSGVDGRVTRGDVRAAIGTATPTEPARDVRVPIKAGRKHIAEAMVRSAFTAPHVTEWVSVDVTRSLKLVQHLREQRTEQPVRPTLLTLVARACLVTLTTYPEINASWDEPANEIVRHADVNLGIAVASPRGLIVPNVRRAQALRFPELAAALANLITDARANKTPLSAMQGGTFTITNVGVFGVDGATPILNLGESAILALGRTNRIPWNHKGKVRLRDVCTLSLSFDHRLVDGQLGSRVLAGIAELLEHPERALVT